MRSGYPFVVLFSCVAGAHAGIDQPETPNDPDFPLQWGLANIGQVVDGIAGVVEADIDALGAWEIHAGSAPVVVAIVATGVDPHPEFADRLLEGRAFVGDLFDSRDVGTLGTHVAGTIAASRNDGMGIAGVNDRVWILPVRVLDGTTGPSAATAAGIRWAVDQRARIIVVPLSFAEPGDDLADAVEYAVAHDVLVIAPVGDHENYGTVFPAAYPDVLAVSATTNRDTLAPLSNFGPRVDIAAPGVDIWSTLPDGTHAYKSGGAVAVGFVAGTAALMCSYAPHLTGAQVAQLLIDSADDLGDVGVDARFGAGRINARRSLESVIEPGLRFEHSAPLPARLNLIDEPLWRVRVVDAAEQLMEGSVRMFYRVDDGPFASTSMISLGDSWYGATFGESLCDAHVEFYFSAMGDGGTLVTDPHEAPGRVHNTIVTRDDILFEDDFEENRGWSVQVEGGGDTRGAWVRVIPAATSAQPGFDFSPDAKKMCFVTGQYFGSDEGLTDVDGGPVRLTSPLILLNEPEIEIQFAYWFRSTHGIIDTLDIELSRDDGASWIRTHQLTSSDGWSEFSLHLSDYPELEGDHLRVRFSAADLSNDSLTEAAIDAFRVTAIRCAGTPGDVDGNGVIDIADYERLAACLLGPAHAEPDAMCVIVDITGDSRVDLADYATFQRAFDRR